MLARPDGDAVAAAGLLARIRTALGCPFQVSVPSTPVERERRAAESQGVTIALGPTDAADTVVDPVEGSVARAAWVLGRSLSTAPDPILAAAGIVAAGGDPGGGDGPLAGDSGVARRPGIAIPTADVADGLAHTALVYADGWDDPETVAVSLDEHGLAATAPEDDGARKRLASFVAMSVAGDPDATPPAGTAVERFLRPHVIDGPVATVGGYADVLDAGVTTDPGAVVALALGRDGEAIRESALDAWRRAGRAARTAVQTGERSRYSGLEVLRLPEAGAGAGAAPRLVARLLLSYRAREPAVLAIGDGRAVAVPVASDGAGDATRLAATAADGTASVTDGYATATFDGTAEEFVAAFREAI
ncbi:exonuclease RecJ [Halobacteriales archaeon SW_7_68_16]|nr:MAG: exonuclease RecJ [Halobacteriales archaeon SW_7_68_16]